MEFRACCHDTKESYLGRRHPKMAGCYFGDAKLTSTRRRAPDLRAHLRQVLARWDLPAAEAVIRSCPVSLYRVGRPRRAGRVLLVGDAAALADPFLGEGIRHAIASGWLAAVTLLEGRPETSPGRVEAGVGRLLRAARLMAAVAYAFPRTAAWSLGTGRHWARPWGGSSRGSGGTPTCCGGCPCFSVARPAGASVCPDKISSSCWCPSAHRDSARTGRSATGHLWPPRGHSAEDLLARKDLLPPSRRTLYLTRGRSCATLRLSVLIPVRVADDVVSNLRVGGAPP